MIGRPTEYSDEVVEKAEQYLHLERGKDLDEVIPSIEGLALYIERARSTIYEWIKDEDKKAFSDIVAAILEKQGKTLLNKGLTGEFASPIAKVILTKHGYRDEQGIDHTTKGDKIDNTVNISSRAAQIIDDEQGTSQGGNN